MCRRLIRVIAMFASITVAENYSLMAQESYPTKPVHQPGEVIGRAVCAVGGEGFAVDASLIRADPNRQRSADGSDAVD